MTRNRFSVDPEGVDSTSSNLVERESKQRKHLYVRARKGEVIASEMSHRFSV